MPGFFPSLWQPRFLPLPVGAAGWQHIGGATGMQTVTEGVELTAGQATARVLAITDSVVRVRQQPKHVV